MDVLSTTFVPFSSENISAAMIKENRATLAHPFSNLSSSGSSRLLDELTNFTPFNEEVGTISKLNVWKSDVSSKSVQPTDPEIAFNDSFPFDNGSLPELPIDMQFNEGHRLAIIIYSFLMIVSAIGNISVFTAIVKLRIKGRLSRINLFLLHLAIADLLVTFLMMPLEIIWNATVSWQANDTMCRVMSFFRIFGLYLSGFVLVCISLDRYFAVLKPLAIPDANSRGRIMLMVAWLASVLCSLPQPLIFHVETHPVFSWYQQCVTFNSFPSPEYELAYNFFGFFFLYGLPLIMIVFCYSRILYEIYRISALKKNEEELRRSNMGALGRAKIRTLKMTVIIVATFFCCWSPYNIMSFWYWFDKKSAAEVDQRIQKGLFLFACTNSCVNPLIYGLFHINSRKKSNSTVIQRSLPHGSHRPPLQSENYKMRVRWKQTECCVMACGSSGSSDRTPVVSTSRRGENHVHVRPTQQFWMSNNMRRMNCTTNLLEQVPRQDTTVENEHSSRALPNAHIGHRRCSRFQMCEFQTRVGSTSLNRIDAQENFTRNHIIDYTRNGNFLSSVL